MTAITQMAASGDVSIPVSIIGKSKPKRTVESLLEIKTPPKTVPKIIEPTVNPSIHPLAATNFSGGSNSVKMPYLAGE